MASELEDPVVTAAVNFIKSIIDSVNNREWTVGICMDLSGAFDTLKLRIYLLWRKQKNTVA